MSYVIERELTPPNPELMRERILHESGFLPTHAEIKIAFPTQKDWQETITTFRDKEFFTVKLFFELWNQEYISGLAEYLTGRLKGSNTILELGAGDGRLTNFLSRQSKLDKRMAGFKFIATDTGEWGLQQKFQVETVKSNQAALDKYNPDLVICSWIPYEMDFTGEIRATASVQEYIVIGEEGGACGDDWKTWGFRFVEDRKVYPPDSPYASDGFTRQDLADLRQFQVCINDQYPDKTHLSRTVAFIRS